MAKALSKLTPGQKLSAFSYGSGCGAELLTLTAGPQVKAPYWVNDVEKDFSKRKNISANEYEMIRQYEKAG